MSGTALSMYFNLLGRRAGLSKRVFPYILRHTRLSSIRHNLSSESYEHFSGHSYATGMYYYKHIVNDELDDEILNKVYNDEELSKEDKQKLKKEIESLKTEMEGMKEMKEFFKRITKDAIKHPKQYIVDSDGEIGQAIETIVPNRKLYSKSK